MSKKLENFLKKLDKKDIIFVRERSVTADKRKNFDLNLFKKYNIKTIFWIIILGFLVILRKNFL